jgi:TRAP-type C4-dicarboxylate transport system permease large subunit
MAWPVLSSTGLGLGCGLVWFGLVWFGIMVVKMAEICLVTPPIGLNCFVVNGGRPDIPLNDVFRGIGPFFVADVATVGLFIAVPEIVTFLPRLMLQDL